MYCLLLIDYLFIIIRSLDFIENNNNNKGEKKQRSMFCPKMFCLINTN